MDEKEKEMIQRIKEDLMKTANSLLETAAPRQLETQNSLLPEDDRNIRIENDVGANGVDCDVLNSQMQSTEDMERHRRYPHEGHHRTCRCPYCLYTAVFLANHRRHLFKHDDEKEQECHLYDKAFIQKGAKGVICNVRNTLLSSTVAMENHKRKRLHRQGKDPKYQCPLCLYSTNRLSDFQRHLDTHTGEKRQKCLVCHKAFITKYQLNRHLMVHSGEKPFTCEICFKSFTRKENLRLHMRTHSGVKPYRCPIS